MEYQLKFYAKEYKHGWTVWIQRNNQKFMIGSAIKTEKEVNELVENINIKKEPLSIETKLNIALEEIERLKEDNEIMKTVLRSMGAVVIG